MRGAKRHDKEIIQGRREGKRFRSLTTDRIKKTRQNDGRSSTYRNKC